MNEALSGARAERDALWQSWRDRTEQRLIELLPEENVEPARLHAAMRYSTLGAGKRLRAIAAYAAARMCAEDDSLIDTSAAALEMVHAYSLIHDDLPAMDDDDLRRGKATCHLAFDEATAILAGDALQSLAFEAIATDPALKPVIRGELVGVLAGAIGPAGMAGGQALDMAATGSALKLDALQSVHAKKTGALIRASVQIGALAAGCKDKSLLATLDDFATKLGLAFQIIDDVLDEEGDTELMGKRQGADRELDKSTYVSLLGADDARATATSLQIQARADIEALPGSEQLLTLLDFAVERRY